MQLSKTLVALVLLVAGAGLAVTGFDPAPALVSPPEPPETPQAITGLVSAQRFTLAQPYESAWRAEHPQVQSGWLLVIAADPLLCVPRNEMESVLQWGAQTLERINSGQDSGRIVAVLPDDVLRQDSVLVLDSEPCFFGPAGLPERMDAAELQRRLDTAHAAQVAPISARELAEAMRRGGVALEFAERDDLQRHAAQLILAHSPTEGDLARGLLVPRLR
jgi:hypothetical protein